MDKLSVGDFIEVVRDLKYFGSGRPFKGSRGVITAVTDEYNRPDNDSVVYRVEDLNGLILNIPHHLTNLMRVATPPIKGLNTRLITLDSGEPVRLDMVRCKDGMFKVSSDNIPLVDVDLCSIPEIVQLLSFEVEFNKAFKNKMSN